MPGTFDGRPDPDQLLEQLRVDEERAQRGKLRIYFGASAGVGKTWAMLSAAQRERAAGRDVVIGVVETHGRAETAQLLTDLEQIPPRQVPYRDKVLPEFDLDAALARRPAVILVDELAHSNLEGSRHAKRWQDVHELLDAGIDVWSALNVQHLESLNGTVGAITGVRVHETVPDSVLEQADELILIDVTPDELIARLAAGKVYLPQQAEQAARNFFRKGNLIALREIALRRTAEHVEDDVRSYRVEKSITPVWHTGGAMLVCVGPHEGAEQAVRTAARLAGQLNMAWHAAYVETARLQRLPTARRDRILAVLKLAEELGAGTAVLTDDDVARALIEHAQRLNCATLVMATARPRAGWYRWLGWLGVTPLAQQLAQRAPALDVLTVGKTSSSRRLDSAFSVADRELPPGHWRERLPGYGWAAAISVGTVLVTAPLFGHLELTNIVMVFLLGVVLVALRFGRGPAAFSALVNVLAFDFFYVQPRYSFAVSDVQYLVTFAVMLIVGLTIGQLTAGLHFQARVASGREQRARALFELTRDLSGALESSEVVRLGEAAVSQSFGGAARILVADEHDRLTPPDPPPANLDLGVADWALRHTQPAGMGTTTLSANPWHYIPLIAPMRARGVLALQPARWRWLRIPEQQRQLDTLARQIAIALEHVHYVGVAQNALVQMESERLRNTLLGAISHDVRTPLTALIGLAESLQGSTPALTAEQQQTTSVIVEQARQMGSLVDNLLDMARLQSGAVRMQRDWHSVEEVVGTSIRLVRNARGQSARGQSAGQSVPTNPPPDLVTDLPVDLPLVEFDAVLIERVLVNLLENALKYGRPPVVVGARIEADALILTVRDHGDGLPAGWRGREADLFEKFTRGSSESAIPGVGLGLAIARAVVVAHGGDITAANADDDASGDGKAGSGAIFTVRLPRREPPPGPE